MSWESQMFLIWFVTRESPMLSHFGGEVKFSPVVAGEIGFFDFIGSQMSRHVFGVSDVSQALGSLRRF